MKQFPFTWQGIGIASDPRKTKDPLSLHLLAYLREAAEISDVHEVIVVDTPQVDNFRALHGTPVEQGRSVAKRKGKQKRKALERICRAQGLDNVVVKQWDDVFGEPQEAMLQTLEEWYRADTNFREAVNKTIPKRMLERCDEPVVIARYALREVALILTYQGVKFGHEREKPYDSLAQRVWSEHKVGSKPQFHYSTHGLEFVPGTGYIEPYGSVEREGRILLTDSKAVFEQRVASLSVKERKKLEQQVEATWGEEIDDKLYNRVVKPSYTALRRPVIVMKALAAACLLTVSSMGVGAAYVDHDAKRMRQERINELSIFAFNGDMKICIMALNGATEKANQDVKDKYRISEYFDKRE